MLMSETLAAGALADAIYTIESIQTIGSRAIALNESIKYGLLSESRRIFLMEDLDKAMKDLQNSSQASLDKLDKAIDFVGNFLEIGNKGKGVAIWDLILESFSVAKEQLNELTTIDLGTMGNIKAFFNSGGKLAAVMDALAAEMNLLSVYIKVLSGAFSQTIRQMKALPDSFKEDKTKADKTKQVFEYVDAAKGVDGNKIDAKAFKKGLEDVMSDIQTKNGGYTIWSSKGISNWWGDNKGKMGIAALGGGLLALAGIATGGLALGPLAAIAGGIGLGGAAAGAIGAATGKGVGTRTTKNACEAYNTSMEAIAQAIMDSEVDKLEALIPAFVEAVKGVDPEEFAKAAEDAQKALDKISDGIDADDLINAHIEKYKDEAKALKTLYTMDSEITKKILVHTMGKGKQGIEGFKDTSIYDNLEIIAGGLQESIDSSHDEDLILEDNESIHDYTMTDLLFEGKKKKSSGSKNKKKKPSGSKNKKKPTAGSSDKKNDKSKSKDSKDSKKSSGVSKAEYQQYKGKMKSTGEKQLAKAERKPQSAQQYSDMVDKYEDKINKKMKNPDRKRNITQIADEYEKKIMALEDEKDTTAPGSGESEDTGTDDKSSGARDILGLSDESAEVKAIRKKTSAIVSRVKGQIKSTLGESLLRRSLLLEDVASDEELEALRKAHSVTRSLEGDVIVEPPRNQSVWQEEVLDNPEVPEVVKNDIEPIVSDTNGALEELDNIQDEVNNSNMSDEDKEKATQEIEAAKQEVVEIENQEANKIIEDVLAQDDGKNTEESPEDSGESKSNYAGLFDKGKGGPLADIKLNAKKMDPTHSKYLTVLFGDNWKQKVPMPSEKNESYDRRILKLAGII